MATLVIHLKGASNATMYPVTYMELLVTYIIVGDIYVHYKIAYRFTKWHIHLPIHYRIGVWRFWRGILCRIICICS